MVKANIVLLSDAVFDSVRDEPFSGGVAISGDKILFVGSKEEVRQYVGPETTVKDFGAGLVMPGFFDGHGHFQTAAVREYGTCISYLELCKSQEEVIEGVHKYLEEHPDCKRVHGRCWMICSWGPGAPYPTKEPLDQEFPDIPVYLLSSSGHAAWLNSAAIRESGIEETLRQHPEWPAEFAPRDEKGELTGFLAENASYTVRYMVEVYTQEEYAEWDKKFLDLFTEYGITSFTDCTGLRSDAMWAYLEPFKRLENKGELHVRINQWCGNNVSGDDADDDVEAGLKTLKLLQTYHCSDKLRIAGAKMMLDGVPDSRTGAMLEPYADAPEIRGELLATPEAYKKCFTLANRMGFAVKCHCLGDRSVRVAIDAFESSRKANGNHKLRNGVEHMNLITDEDIRRMADLDLIASVQPAHMVDWFHGCGEALFGHERNLRDSRYRTLLDAGIHLSIGTDTPVVTFAPLHTVYEAVTRKDEEGMMHAPFTSDQALTVAEALKGYTIGAAYANAVETKVGTLEPGKYADIAVIDRNLFTIPADKIKDCINICTVFDGKIIYEMT